MEGMMWPWYIGIGVFVLLTLYAYRTKRSLTRMTIDEVSDINRIMGTEFGVTAMACVALGLLLTLTFKSDPGTKGLKDLRHQQELATYHALGEVLGKELAAKAKPKSAGLLIVPDLGDPGKAYIEAIVKGLEKSCGNKVSFKRREVVKPDSAEDDREIATAEAIVLPTSKFIRIASKNNECNVIVSLVDIESSYTDTSFASDVGSAKKFFCLVTKNPYMLGRALELRRISFCVVPTRTPTYNGIPGASPQQLFDQRFLMISDKKSLATVVKTNKKMFYMTKRME